LQTRAQPAFNPALRLYPPPYRRDKNEKQPRLKPMKPESITTALKIAAARDAFLIAKANFSEAEKEYFAHCQVVTFEFEGAEHAMFCFERDEYNQVEWRYTPEYAKTRPARPPIALNEDFIAWQAAYKAKVRAKAKQARAMRKLLTVGL
jgi:uncharacterized protein (DUF1330 family)